MRRAAKKTWLSSSKGRDSSRRSYRKWATSDRGREVKQDIAERWRANPDNLLKIRHRSRLHRELAAGLCVDIPLGYEALVFEVFGRRCAACGALDRIELDHHRARSKGNSLLHDAVPLCRRCNRRKGNKEPEDFYDAWKLVEVLVGLHEVRELFEQRFGSRAAVEAV